MGTTNKLLAEHKVVAQRLDYFKNAKELEITDKELIQRLADDYCLATDTKDQILRDRAMAGLLVKFWREISKMQKKCAAVSHLEYGDFYAQLYYCIETAMKYRAWQNPEKHTTAQACINSTISSRGAAEILYQSNLDKNKININCASLDTPLNEDSDDKETTLGDTIADDKSGVVFSGADCVIQSYLDKNEIIKAIVIDKIAHADSIKVESKVVGTFVDEDGKEIKLRETTQESSSRKIVASLASLQDEDVAKEYINYFCHRFNVVAKTLIEAVDSLKNAKSTKIRSTVEKTLLDLRSDRTALISILTA